jgi:AraC-like DNA-binding protein
MRGSMLTVAYDSGFNAKSTFNRAFKKATGHSPTEFQVQLGGAAADSRPES